MLRLDVDRVAALIRAVAGDELVPRFRALRDHEVLAKATAEDPGDVVTHADLACERRLTAELAALLPGSVVVGEEAVAAEPRVLEALHGDRPAWIVDPLDGTKNFVEGREDFGVIVALCVGGETRFGWIHLPVPGRTLIAELGSGAFERDEPGGEPRRLRPDGPPAEPLLGTVYTRYVSQELRERVEAHAPRHARIVVGTGNASSEYAFLARGEKDFALYGRLLPWDHAAGALIVSEAGGAVRLIDGRPYVPGTTERGALGVRHAPLWDAARAAVVGDLPPRS